MHAALTTRFFPKLAHTNPPMNTRFKNRVRYWLLAVIPLAAVALSGRLIGSSFFVLLLFFYTFVYRPLLDTQRLMALGQIEEKDAWRFFVPFAVDHTRYLKALWLG